MFKSFGEHCVQSSDKEPQEVVKTANELTSAPAHLPTLP
jgi:hypothetical protein